jgi:hypothetical protein
MVGETPLTKADALLAELRSRRLAKESAARAEHADALAKQVAKAAANRRELLSKFDRLDQMFGDVHRLFVDVNHRLVAIEKAQSALAIKPTRRELTSWSPEMLATAMRDMSRAELAKLLQ